MIRPLVCLLPLLLWETVIAQQPTLTEQLGREVSDKLVLEAQERGDIVRGAILFHQGNIACAKCHRPQDEKDRIGPDLSRLGDDVTAKSIVDSILYPSKVIKKEYRTSVVVLQSGRVHTGVIVEQTDATLVLRDAGNVTSLITIARSDIEEVAVGDTSIMPAKLADELKSRQQFLDLLRYVLDLKQRGPATMVRRSAERRELSPELQGRVLLSQYNCTACHEDSQGLAAVQKTSAPNLRWSAKHLNPDYLAQMIADPHAAKPGSYMPQMMSQTAPDARREVAGLIVDFLTSLDGSIYPEPSEPVDTSAAQRGHEVFQSVGCVACHAPRDKRAVEQSLANSVPLGDLSGKYSQTALVALLEDPQRARPHGRMPNLQLTHREALDTAAFLLQGASPAHSRPAASPERIAQGQSLFHSLKCSACHRIDDQAVTPATPLTDVDSTLGCLADRPNPRTPHFAFREEQKSALRAALSAPAKQLTDAQKIDTQLTHFHCTACHQRDSLGGVADVRRAHFQTTNLNLGEQGRIPPTLTGVGAKLKAKWMRDVLVNGRSIRPYMKTRMPGFVEADITDLMTRLQAADSLSPTPPVAIKDQKAARQQGVELAGNKGLNCVACHTYQYKIADTMPAVDLTEMAERLQKDWFHQYMLSPQTFSPNTVMPSFWPGGNAIRSDLAGTPAEQVEALWQYLLDGRQARAPRGVLREPLEIVVTNEARMLRRGYPGMGKRGIGVGYPGGVNIAFDAEQLRLATLWKGQFVDPGGVWYGQGHGRVRPMGRTVTLPAGPDVDWQNNAWVVDDGRPTQHRFLGYDLDRQRQPTFRYAIGSVNVSDFYCPETVDGKVQLGRQITLTSDNPSEPLRLRLLSGPFRLSADGKAMASERLRIRVLSDHTVQTGAGNTAEIRLTPEAGQATKVVLQYQWE
ncbi:MAG: c-type cytochrome [Planctomycetaceae bacterium]|nr:c-type cytochrome [Planctomycetaceae bacterium]